MIQFRYNDGRVVMVNEQVARQMQQEGLGCIVTEPMVDTPPERIKEVISTKRRRRA